MGFTPWGSIIGATAGIAQSIIGGIQASKAQKALEALKTPTYTPSSSILDYYNKALSKYQENPYQSELYKMQNQNIQRGVAQGLNTLAKGTSLISGVSSLIQGQNDAQLKAGAAAEQQRNQNLSQLGSAAAAKAREDDKMFKYNQLAPYQKKYNLLAAKAQGGNSILNAGLRNISGGLQMMDYFNANKK